jgi:hypothetical protein
MDLEETEARNDLTGESQQKFNRPAKAATVLTVTKIWSCVPDGGLHQEWPPYWPSVVMWLWLVGLETKKHWAGESQQQFNRQTVSQSVKAS